MRKAQGALEYLIIIAAVLAIAAIVVLFLTNALTSTRTGGDLATCKAAATQCYNGIVTGVYSLDTPISKRDSISSGCREFCIDACSNINGYDVLSDPADEMTVDENTCRPQEAAGCGYCAAGQPENVFLG